MIRFFSMAVLSSALCIAVASAVLLPTSTQATARGAKNGLICVANASCTKCQPFSGCNLVYTPEKFCRCGVLGTTGCTMVGVLKTCVSGWGNCVNPGPQDCGPAQEPGNQPTPFQNPATGLWECDPSGTCVNNPGVPASCWSCTST